MAAIALPRFRLMSLLKQQLLPNTARHSSIIRSPNSGDPFLVTAIRNFYQQTTAATTNLDHFPTSNSFKTVNDSQLSELRASNNLPYVIFAYTRWSEKCRQLSDTLCNLLRDGDSKVSERVIQFDADQNPKLAKRFRTKTVPTLQLWYYGKLLIELSGTATKGQILEFIERANDYPSVAESDDAQYFKYFTGSGKLSHESRLAALKVLKEKSETDVEAMKGFKPYLCAHKLEMELASPDVQFSRILDLMNEIRELYSEALEGDAIISNVMSRATIFLFDHPQTVANPLNDIVEDFKLLTAVSHNPEMKSIVYTRYEKLLFAEPCLSADSMLCYDLSNSMLQGDGFDYNKLIQKEIGANDLEQMMIGRLSRVIASKLYRQGEYRMSINYAINESYKRDTELKDIMRPDARATEPSPAVVLLNSIFSATGYEHGEVKRGLAMMMIATKKDLFKKVTIPFPKSYKGGRPRMLRGKSGKWEWLGPEWKPPWVKKFGNWSGPEEWALKR